MNGNELILLIEFPASFHYILHFTATCRSGHMTPLPKILPAFHLSETQTPLRPHCQPAPFVLYHLVIPTSWKFPTNIVSFMPLCLYSRCLLRLKFLPHLTSSAFKAQLNHNFLRNCSLYPRVGVSAPLLKSHVTLFIYLL